MRFHVHDNPCWTLLNEWLCLHSLSQTSLYHQNCLFSDIMRQGMIKQIIEGHATITVVFYYLFLPEHITFIHTLRRCLSLGLVYRVSVCVCVCLQITWVLSCSVYEDS